MQGALLTGAGAIIAATLSGVVLWRVHTTAAVQLQRDLDILSSLRANQANPDLVNAWRIHCEREALRLNIQDSRWGYWSPTLRRFLALQGAALIVAGIAVLLMDGPVGPRLAVSLMMVFSGVGACWVVYVVSNDMHLTDERIRSAHRKLDQTYEIQAVAIEGVDIDLEPQESHSLDPAQHTRNLWARLTAAATLFSRIRHVRRRGALATELADLPEGNLSGPKRN